MKNQIIISEPTFEKARKSIRESQKKDSESRSNCSQQKGQGMGQENSNKETWGANDFARSYSEGKHKNPSEVASKGEQFAKQKLPIIFSSSDEIRLSKACTRSCKHLWAFS